MYTTLDRSNRVMLLSRPLSISIINFPPTEVVCALCVKLRKKNWQKDRIFLHKSNENRFKIGELILQQCQK